MKITLGSIILNSSQNCSFMLARPLPMVGTGMLWEMWHLFTTKVGTMCNTHSTSLSPTVPINLNLTQSCDLKDLNLMSGSDRVLNQTGIQVLLFPSNSGHLTAKEIAYHIWHTPSSYQLPKTDCRLWPISAKTIALNTMDSIFFSASSFTSFYTCWQYYYL